MSVSLFSNIPQFTTFSASSNSHKAPQTDSRLLEAIIGGNSFEVERLITKNKALMHIPLSDGQLPLNAAVRLQSSSIVRFLMNQGCDSSLRDSQGMTAIDYAVLKQDPDILRLLLPAKLVQTVDATKHQVDSFEFAERQAVEDLSKKIQSDCDKAKKNPYASSAEPTSKDVIKAIYCATDELAKAAIAKSSGFNQCNVHGISPMHAAAAMGRANLLQEMASRGGDLFEKNLQGVAPADLLLNSASEKDPHRFQKAQLLFTFIKVGSLLADRYVVPSLSPDASKLWYASLLLLNLGADLTLSYQAYQRLNPQSMLSKAMFWASSVASVPLQYGLLKLPGARVVWDLLRAHTVCREAFAKIQYMYRNYTYDPARSIGHIVHQITDVCTTLYQVKGSIAAAKQFIFKDVSDRELDVDKQKMATEALLKQEKDNIADSKKQIENREREIQLREIHVSELEKTHDKYEAEYERLNKVKADLDKAVATSDRDLYANAVCRVRTHELKTQYQGQIDSLNHRLTENEEAWSHKLKTCDDNAKIESTNLKQKCKDALEKTAKEHEENVRVVSKLYHKLIGQKPLPYLLDDKLQTDKFNDAVCMVYGSNSNDSGKLGMGFPDNEKQLNTFLGDRTNEIHAIYTNDNCKKAGIPDICTTLNKNIDNAISTIKNEVIKSHKPGGTPLPYNFKCKPYWSYYTDSSKSTDWLNA